MYISLYLILLRHDGGQWWWLRRRWSNSMWIVRCIWKKRDHEGVVCLHDDLENLREGRRFACRSWTVPFVEDRPRWRSITRVSSYGGLGDRCERSIGRSADTWTASPQCACGSGVLTHRNARIATRNPPNCICTASLLELNQIHTLVIYLRLKDFYFFFFLFLICGFPI